jgi:hypothetical protein
MRAWVVLLALLLLPLPVLGQAPATVLSDPKGDVLAGPPGSGQPAPPEAYGYLDLESLSVSEQDDTFTFVVKVADLRSYSETPTEGGVIDVAFLHNDREFRLSILRFNFFGGSTSVSLYARPAGGSDWAYQWRDPNAIQADEAADTYTVVVPRGDLADAQGAPPFLGRNLEQFEATSRSLLSNPDLGIFGGDPVAEVPFQVVDRMPNQGREGVFPVTKGLAQTGHARLQSAEPRRASNGEASTFVFSVTARNLGDNSDVFTLSTRDVPSNWVVTLPQPVVELAGGDAAELPVVLSTPFAHQHGTFTTFIVELTSVADPTSVGRVELGLTFLEVPQPAGHHDTLYFHSVAAEGFGGTFGTAFAGNDGRVYMNAAEQHEGDSSVAVTGTQTGLNARNTQTSASYRWWIPLDPGLQMGLDFDITRPGKVVLPIETTMVQPGAQVSGRLVWVDADFPVTPNTVELAAVATIGTFASDAADLGPDARRLYELDVAIDPVADLIPYKSSNNIILIVTLNTTRPGTVLAAEAPRLAPGGSLQLPLYEYHDPIVGSFQSGSGAKLRLLGQPNVVRNPGAVAHFAGEISGPKGAYSLELLGVNNEWARLAGKSTVQLPASGPIGFDVIVDIPKDARDGDRADLVLQATPASGGAATLLRLLVEVDTDSTHPDDREHIGGLGEGKKKSPGAPVLFVSLAILGLAWAARRSRL